jgi:acetyltransferase-like isoleucine patch superfamily enzyme
MKRLSVVRLDDGRPGDGSSCKLFAVSSVSKVLERLRRRVIDRIRGEPNIERMVAQGLQLGEGTHIAHPIYLDRLHPWLITIDDYATLAPYVALITHDASLNQHTGQTRLGRVIVGKRVHVGVGAVLLPGTSIGDDSVVGAGAVVHGEIPPGSLVVGNPAQISAIKPVAAWHRASAARAPTWPDQGWTIFSGITQERKQTQREALAPGASGYVPADPAPGSPFLLGSRASASDASRLLDGEAPGVRS